MKSTPEGVGFEARLHCMDARYGVRGVDIKVTPDSHRAVSRHIYGSCVLHLAAWGKDIYERDRLKRVGFVSMTGQNAGERATLTSRMRGLGSSSRSKTTPDTVRSARPPSAARLRRQMATDSGVRIIQVLHGPRGGPYSPASIRRGPGRFSLTTAVARG